MLSQSKLKAKSSELELSLKTIKELETKVDKLEKALAESKGAEAKLRAQVGLVKGFGCWVCVQGRKNSGRRLV